MGKMFAVLRAMDAYEKRETPQRTECPVCEGTGVNHWDTARMCLRCHGTGTVSKGGKRSK